MKKFEIRHIGKPGCGICGMTGLVDMVNARDVNDALNQYLVKIKQGIVKIVNHRVHLDDESYVSAIEVFEE